MHLTGVRQNAVSFTDPALGLDDLSAQVIVTAVHISDFFMKLLHRLDAVCLQKAEQRSAFLQGPDFVGADAALFHLAGVWPQMDRGNLINALPLVAAMVNALRSAGRFQRPIGVGRPRCPPNLHTFFIVPVGRILPVIFPTAFPIRDTLSYSSRSCRMMFLLPSGHLYSVYRFLLSCHNKRPS